MENIKILIADDEPDVLQILAKRVASEGYTVDTAEDGEQAWEKIVSGLPDLIILDLMMPKIDGFTILKNLRANPPSPKWQPVIIVSANDELANMQKTFLMDADHYLTKPCSIQDVLKAIRLMVSLIPQRKPDEETGGDKTKNSH